VLFALLSKRKMDSAVLPKAVFGCIQADWVFFPERDGIQTVVGDAQGDKTAFNEVGAAIAQPDVVFGGPAFIAMAFYCDHKTRIFQ